MASNQNGDADSNKHLLVATSRKLSKEYRQLYALLTGSLPPPFTVYRAEDSCSDDVGSDASLGDSYTSTSAGVVNNSFLSSFASTLYNHSASVVTTLGGWSGLGGGSGSAAGKGPLQFYAPASLLAAVQLPISISTSTSEQFILPLLLTASKKKSPDTQKHGNRSFRRTLRQLQAEVGGKPDNETKRSQARDRLFAMMKEYSSEVGVNNLLECMGKVDRFESLFVSEVVPLLATTGSGGPADVHNARVVPIREPTYEAAFAASEAIDAIVGEVERRGALLNQLLLVCDHLIQPNSSANGTSSTSSVFAYLGFRSSSAAQDGVSSTSYNTSTSQFLFDLCLKGYTEELRMRCRGVLSMSDVEAKDSPLLNHLSMVKQCAAAVVETGFDGLGIPTAPSFDNVFNADAETTPTSFTQFQESGPSNVVHPHRENGFTSSSSSSASTTPPTTPPLKTTDPAPVEPVRRSTKKAKAKSNSPEGTANHAVKSTTMQKEMKRVASTPSLVGGRRTAIEEQRVVLHDGTAATLYVEVPLEELDLEAERQRHMEIEEVTRGMAEVRELQALINEHALRQEEQLRAVETSAGLAHTRAAGGRLHLTKASKYQVVGAVVAGAVLGAAVGGPIGLLIGAKSTATVGGALALGGVTGGVGAKVVTSASARNAARVDDDYEDRRERGEL